MASQVFYRYPPQDILSNLPGSKARIIPYRPLIEHYITGHGSMAYERRQHPIGHLLGKGALVSWRGSGAYPFKFPRKVTVNEGLIIGKIPVNGNVPRVVGTATTEEFKEDEIMSNKIHAPTALDVNGMEIDSEYDILARKRQLMASYRGQSKLGNTQSKNEYRSYGSPSDSSADMQSVLGRAVPGLVSPSLSAISSDRSMKDAQGSDASNQDVSSTADLLDFMGLGQPDTKIDGVTYDDNRNPVAPEIPPPPLQIPVGPNLFTTPMETDSGESKAPVTTPMETDSGESKAPVSKNSAKMKIDKKEIRKRGKNPEDSSSGVSYRKTPKKKKKK